MRYERNSRLWISIFRTPGPLDFLFVPIFSHFCKQIRLIAVIAHSTGEIRRNRTGMSEKISERKPQLVPWLEESTQEFRGLSCYRRSDLCQMIIRNCPLGKIFGKIPVGRTSFILN